MHASPRRGQQEPGQRMVRGQLEASNPESQQRLPQPLDRGVVVGVDRVALGHVRGPTPVCKQHARVDTRE
jgi:hypothetical protein